MFEQKEALRAMTKHLPEREQKKRELSELNWGNNNPNLLLDWTDRQDYGPYVPYLRVYVWIQGNIQ
jgi:hypothetical protein